MMEIQCKESGDDVETGMAKLGYKLCLFCGEEAAIAERKSWCEVQQYGKGNNLYTAVYKITKE